MELRHLRYFVALAEELHFGRAAERVFVAQSTMSGQIKKLEEELGVRLFERTKRSVALTETGRTFLPFARRTLRDAEHAEEAARRAERGLLGTLRVGYASMAMHSGGLPEVLRIFRENAPDVKLKLFELAPPAQAEALRNEEIDVGFLPLPTDERGLQVMQLAETPSVAVLPERHRLASKRRIALSELAEEPFVSMRRTVAPEVFDEYMRACRAAGFMPRIAQEVDNHASLLALVATRLGVALAPEPITNVQRPGVVYARLGTPTPTVRTGAAWREGDASPTLERLLRTTREVAAARKEPEA